MPSETVVVGGDQEALARCALFKRSAEHRAGQHEVGRGRASACPRLRYSTGGSAEQPEMRPAGPGQLISPGGRAK